VERNAFDERNFVRTSAGFEVGPVDRGRCVTRISDGDAAGTWFAVGRGIFPAAGIPPGVPLAREFQRACGYQQRFLIGLVCGFAHPHPIVVFHQNALGRRKSLPER
jgi:hypothetical protein